MKFEKLFKKILNESSSAIDPRQMKASVGWIAHEGIADEPYDFNQFGEAEDVEAWIADGGLEEVTFKKGASDVMNYAREQGAEKEDLIELKQKLIELGKNYSGGKFFVYGIEADWSLGVI